MRWLIAITALTVVVAVWVTAIRPVLRKQDWAKPFFDAIEPIERALWWKSETILFARFKIVVGLVLTLLTQAQAIDITPLMPFVPDAWEPFVKVLWNAMPLTITVMGWVDERLRKDTTKPLEIVAMRTDAPESVKAAADAVAVASADVVDAVKTTETV
jgi:hypothetical protein